MWVRGLKQILNPVKPLPHLVAPRVGAWIETTFTDQPAANEQSHPVWVRGLKPLKSSKCLTVAMSHPVWVRGLKLSIFVD